MTLMIKIVIMVMMMMTMADERYIKYQLLFLCHLPVIIQLLNCWTLFASYDGILMIMLLWLDISIQRVGKMANSLRSAHHSRKRKDHMVERENDKCWMMMKVTATRYYQSYSANNDLFQNSRCRLLWTKEDEESDIMTVKSVSTPIASLRP